MVLVVFRVVTTLFILRFLPQVLNEFDRNILEIMPNKTVPGNKFDLK